MDFGIVALLLLVVDLSIGFVTGKPSGVCTSQGGRFPPFASDGKPPGRVSKGPKDLTLCRVFRKKTCCDVAQTHPALLSIRQLATTGEASPECLHLWELLECSICDPQVGVKPGPPVLCASLCNKLFEACSTAYFSMDGIRQILAPCGVGDFVCGQAPEWVSNGTELCRAAGFAVQQSDDATSIKEPTCYGGKASIDSVADSWKSSQSKMTKETGNFGVSEEFLQWVAERPFLERVSWAVGGMVLTAGLIYMSKRRSHSHGQKLAAIRRTARRMETNMNQKFPTSGGRKLVERR
uniref:Folate receptor-like domain-containing protein n=1 Tax=Kalanchoe fedtschenkoi TaxID=63787 RepID=A0A7N0U6Z2_KALFE